MDEFDFINTYLAPLAGPEGLNLKDDAACFTPPPGCDLVFTKDTMVEGVHFPHGRYGGDTAEKLLRVNLSDLAAKGARPIGYLLSVAIPKNIDRKFLGGFAKGLSDVQQAYDFTLWGGDTVSTEGPMIVTATLIGTVPSGGMVKRSGAKASNDVWVSGTIGDAYLGLQRVLERPILPAPDGDALWHWEEAYLRPEPRLLLRKLLREFATAAVDISDGLIADISHLAKASGVGIKLSSEAIPFSDCTQKWLSGQEDTQEATVGLITSGDDYEVAFTARHDDRDKVLAAASALGVAITRIGQCEKGEAVGVFDKNNDVLNISRQGYVHF